MCDRAAYGPTTPVVGDVQAHAGAPSGAVVRVRGAARRRCRARRRRTARAPRAAPARFSSRWWARSMWPNSAPPGALGRVAVERRLGPDVRAPVRARLEHAHGVGAPELRLVVVGDARDHPLAGDRVGDEDHATVETCDADAAVRDVGSVEFDLAGPRIVAHSSEHRRRRMTEPERPRAPLPRLDLARPARDAARGRHRADRDPVARRRGGRRRRRRTRSPPPELVLLLARLKAEAVAGSPGRRRARSTGSSSAATRRSSSTASSTASRTCPRSPASAGTRSAGASGLLHSGHWLIDAPRRHRRPRGRRRLGRDRAASPPTSTTTRSTRTSPPASRSRSPGAFTIDARGAGFIESIEGDPHTVVGLSVPLLRTLVRQLGIAWPSLWNR